MPASYVDCGKIKARFLKFQETFPDDGDINMIQALRVYKQAGCVQPVGGADPAPGRRWVIGHPHSQPRPNHRAGGGIVYRWSHPAGSLPVASSDPADRMVPEAGPHNATGGDPPWPDSLL